MNTVPLTTATFAVLPEAGTEATLVGWLTGAYVNVPVPAVASLNVTEQAVADPPPAKSQLPPPVRGLPLGVVKVTTPVGRPNPGRGARFTVAVQVVDCPTASVPTEHVTSIDGGTGIYVTCTTNASGPLTLPARSVAWQLTVVSPTGNCAGSEGLHAIEGKSPASESDAATG
jgi:hypothetical protein